MVWELQHCHVYVLGEFSFSVIISPFDIFTHKEWHHLPYLNRITNIVATADLLELYQACFSFASWVEIYQGDSNLKFLQRNLAAFISMILLSRWYSYRADTLFTLILFSRWYSFHADTLITLIILSRWYSYHADTHLNLETSFTLRSEGGSFYNAPNKYLDIFIVSDLKDFRS